MLPQNPASQAVNRPGFRYLICQCAEPATPFVVVNLARGGTPIKSGAYHPTLAAADARMVKLVVRYDAATARKDGPS